MFRLEIHGVTFCDEPSIRPGSYLLRVSDINEGLHEAVIIQASSLSWKIVEKKDIFIGKSASRVNLTLLASIASDRVLAQGSFFIEECASRVVTLYDQGTMGKATLNVEVAVHKTTGLRSSPTLQALSSFPTDFSTKEDASATDILGHLLSDLGSTRHLIETHRRWLIRCGPFRVAQRVLIDLVKWREIQSTLLFMLVWTWFCLSPNTVLAILFPFSIVGTWYIHVLIKYGVLNLKKPYFEDLNENLIFNESFMDSWCRFYDKFSTVDVGQWLHRGLIAVIICGIVIYIVPFNILALVMVNVILLSNFPLVDSGSILSNIPSVLSNDKLITFEVYENQRWWLGNWSDKGLSIGTGTIHPWSDKSGHVSLNKASVELPNNQWEWEGLWQVDKDGWMYAINFFEDDSAYHPAQRPSDFVRRRRWQRIAKKI